MAPIIARGMSYLPSESAYSLSANRSKRSIMVNFEEPEELAILHWFIEQSSAFVKNFVFDKFAEMRLA